MLDNYIADVKQWLHKPYDDQGTALHWFLFLGFTICTTILWTRVIRRLAD